MRILITFFESKSLLTIDHLKIEVFLANLESGKSLKKDFYFASIFFIYEVPELARTFNTWLSPSRELIYSMNNHSSIKDFYTMPSPPDRSIPNKSRV